MVSLTGKDLKWAYIGNRGFAVLWGSRIVFQLSATSKTGDGVALARAGQIGARDRDVVVVDTDGLFDNIRDTQLEHAVQIGTRLEFSAKEHGWHICWAAYETSR
ncbi:hypothetical protein BS78_10G148400 [Paspalum vaginatum]|nr:hypothetical protein BS78_10G148400 [Paspalum vaginatum]